MRSTCTLFTGALIAASLATSATVMANEAVSGEREIVAVDARDLSAYWRHSTHDRIVVELSGGDLDLYGCVAVPFVLHPDGTRELGLRPLQVKTGQAKGNPIRRLDLYPLAVDALPQFEAVWDKPLSASIYTSYPVVVLDSKIRGRLDEAQWTSLMDRLRAACEIQGLASWIERHPDSTVEEDLPASVEQFLR